MLGHFLDRNSCTHRRTLYRCHRPNACLRVWAALYSLDGREVCFGNRRCRGARSRVCLCLHRGTRRIHGTFLFLFFVFFCSPVHNIAGPVHHNTNKCHPKREQEFISRQRRHFSQEKRGILSEIHQLDVAAHSNTECFRSHGGTLLKCPEVSVRSGSLRFRNMHNLLTCCSEKK